MDQKSEIMDEQTNTQIDIQSTQTNPNSQFYNSTDTSAINNQTYHRSDNSFKRHKNSPSSSDNQFCTHYHNFQNQPLIRQYQNQFQTRQSYSTKNRKPELDLQKFALCLESIEHSLTRVFYRAFQKKLISFYIHSLKQEQRKQRQTRQIQIKLLKQQNWPFKQLFYKKFKNQNEQIMFEFINMCAQKIQANFKGYLTFKRHKQTLKKLNNFKQKLSAITIGWKSWNIFNCKKLKEIRKTAGKIQDQIDSEVQNPNMDKFKKMKKIEYLNSSLEVVKQNFYNSFKNLFNSGAWIYEVDKCFKTPLNNKKTSKTAQSYQFQDESANQMQNEITTNQELRQANDSKSRTRKRQFQVGLNKNNKQSHTPTKTSISFENQPVTTKVSYDSTKNDQSSAGFEERPIVAKGKYELREQDIKNTQNEFLKLKDNQKPNQINQQHQSPIINKFKDDEKKKLVKRQKYDPRKAIQEQKLRLQEQKKKKLQAQKSAPETPNQIPNNAQKKRLQKKNNQANKKTPRITKKQPERRYIQSPRQSSKEKTVQKIKSHLTKKGDNSKSIKMIVKNKKVESKVNCWGPKKDSSQTQIPISEQSSYKSKYLISLKQRTESKLAQAPSHKQEDASRKLNKDQKAISINEQEFVEQKEEAPKINNMFQRKNTQTYEDQTFQSSYLRKLVEEKEKGSFSYGGGSVPGPRKFIQKANQTTKESYAQKIEQLNNNMKRLSQNGSSMANMKNINQQQQRKGSISQASQTQPQKKKQQVHRSIQFLEGVYSSQYTDRLNILKNKLNMLQSTRYIQRDDTIPILLEDSKFIKKIYKDHAFSSLYWPQVRTMETNFLDYIKFSGF